MKRELRTHLDPHGVQVEAIEHEHVIDASDASIIEKKRKRATARERSRERADTAERDALGDADESQ